MNSNLFQNGTNNLSLNTIPQSNTFSSSQKQYWCHICKKSFLHIEENLDIHCPFCDKTFCEILISEDTSDPSHPKNFEPFILNNASQANDNSNSNFNNNSRNLNNNLNNSHMGLILNGRLGHFLLLLSQLRRNRTENRMNIFQNNNNYLDYIINQLMINDTNNYGNPPAAKKEVEKLKKLKITEEKLKEFGIENTCAVCKDEFKIGEDCLLMPCNHQFHDNCIMPWLNKRNSCPVCRYELPTDDKDFEEMKKLKSNRINNNASNVDNQNSS